MNGDALRKTADRVVHAPRNLLDWLLDPVFPERVANACLLALLLGAVITGAIAGPLLPALYAGVLIARQVARQVHRWRTARRDAKQAKAAAADKGKGILGDVTRNVA